MPRSILFADDDKSMLSLYARIFSGTDYSISTAVTFHQAEELIRANDYDLLVTDFMFPDGRGTELIDIFKEKKAGGKSMLVTGSAIAPERAQLEGLDGYFEKPFRVNDLLAAIAEALG